MFESLHSKWVLHQHRVRIANQRRGRQAFLFVYTVLIGLCIFSLIHTLLHGQILGPDGMLIFDAVGIPACMATGYLVGLLLWRRELRLTGNIEE